MPKVLSPSSIEWDEHDVVAQTVSPFSGQTQTFDWQAAWWEARVSLPPMPRHSHDAWSAFLSRMRGSLKTFMLGDPKARLPKGSAMGSPVVSGAGQTGYSVATRGWSPNQPSLFLPGDFIQIGIRLHKVTDLVSSDANGLATLPIWPPLRDKPADNMPIVTRNCKGAFVLKASNGNKHSTNVGLYGFSGFDIREALPVQGATGAIAGGYTPPPEGGGTGGVPTFNIVAVTTWFNTNGSNMGSVAAGGLVGTVSIGGAAAVAIPDFSFTQAAGPPTATADYYAFFCLGQDLQWRTFWGGLLASGGIPNSALVAARKAAGDIVFLAEWHYVPQGQYQVLGYGGGSVGVYQG